MSSEHREPRHLPVLGSILNNALQNSYPSRGDPSASAKYTPSRQDDIGRMVEKSGAHAPEVEPVFLPRRLENITLTSPRSQSKQLDSRKKPRSDSFGAIDSRGIYTFVKVFTTAPAHFSPSIAADTIPPAYPAPSPHGNNPLIRTC